METQRIKARPVALVCVVLLALLLLVPPSASVQYQVNAVHCAQVNGSQYKAVLSGPPYHDHNIDLVASSLTPVNLRGDCDGIVVTGAPQFADRSYAIGDDDEHTDTYAETFLRSNTGDPVSIYSCLKWSDVSDPIASEWECSEHSTTSTSMGWIPISVSLEFPITNNALVDAYHVWVQAGDSEPSGPLDEEDARFTNVYNGPVTLTARITDPGQADNAYIDSTNWSAWIVHDPDEDDELVVGGIPILLNPGSSLLLAADNVRIAYDEHATEGNQWTVTSEDGSDHVFVHQETLGGPWLVKTLE